MSDTVKTEGDSAGKFCVIGLNAANTGKSIRRTWFDTPEEAAQHGDAIIARQKREHPTKAPLRLLVVQVVQVVEEEVPKLTRRKPRPADYAGHTAEPEEE